MTSPTARRNTRRWLRRVTATVTATTAGGVLLLGSPLSPLPTAPPSGRETATARTRTGARLRRRDPLARPPGPPHRAATPCAPATPPPAGGPLPRVDPRAARPQPPRPARDAVRRRADPDPGRRGSGAQGAPAHVAAEAPQHGHQEPAAKPRPPGHAPLAARRRQPGQGPPGRGEDRARARGRPAPRARGRLAGVRLAAAQDLLRRSDRRHAGPARHGGLDVDVRRATS